MTQDERRRLLLYRTETRLADAVKQLDAVLKLHTALQPTPDNRLRRAICVRCSANAWSNERYPCVTRRRLLAARRLLTLKAKK